MSKPKLDKDALFQKHFQIETNRLKSSWCFGDKELRSLYPTLADLLSAREEEFKKIQLSNQQAEEASHLADITKAPEVDNTVRADEAEAWLRDNGVKIPEVKATLKPFQWKAVMQLWKECIINKKQGVNLQSGVGTGKTFMLGMFYALLKENSYCEGKTFAPWPFLLATKASVVPQTIRVFEYQFRLKQMHDILITNYDQLRSSFGEQLLESYYIVKGDREILKFKWKRFLYPLVVCWDECHSLKNEDSQQSKIAQAFNELKDENLLQIHMSATPFTRIVDMRCFAVSTKANIHQLFERLKQ